MPDLTAGLAIAWFYGGFWGLRRGLLGILIIALVHGGGQLLVSPFAPAIGNFLATAVALLLVYPLGRWGPYSREDDRQPQRIFGEDGEGRAQGEKEVRAWTVMRKAAREELPSTTAITALILLSQVMDTAGELPLLAMGIAAVASPLVFLGLSDFIGILGAFVTSSNTASNILMTPLQVATAELEGLPRSLVIALQGAGGAIGNAIAPGDLLVGATAVGISQQLGAVIAKVLPWVLITGALTAGLGYVFYLTLF